MKIARKVLVIAAMAAGTTATVQAATPDDILKGYEADVKKSDKGFKGFSADAGKKFYAEPHSGAKGEKIACASCHTPDPTKTGKERDTGKAIEPLAPSANKERFTDKSKVEKWFKRNCKEVLARECTVKEKGDFVAFLKSVK